MGNLISQDSGSRNDPNVDASRYLQRFFLKRLQRFISIRRERGPLLEVGDINLRLLDKAVYSTFCDCLDLGAGQDARAVLRHEVAGVDGIKPGEDSSN